MSPINIPKEWYHFLQGEFTKPYWLALHSYIYNEELKFEVYPERNKRFDAFTYTLPADVKVVILGQDPYHGPKQANGLAFSVNETVKTPPSLINIFKELKDDIETMVEPSSNLTNWARQGVLLLNSILSVRKNEAASHRNKGWERFTDSIIEKLSYQNPHIVFVLWGAYAQKKVKLINQSKHTVIKSVHPSPLSAYRGFFGSKPFSKINNALLQHHQTPINW